MGLERRQLYFAIHHPAARGSQQLTVPGLPKDLFDGVPASVTVVDTDNYYPKLRDGHIEALEAGMVESVWVSSQLDRPVVKAFNMSLLLDKLLEPAEKKRQDLLRGSAAPANATSSS